MRALVLALALVAAGFGTGSLTAGGSDAPSEPGSDAAPTARDVPASVPDDIAPEPAMVGRASGADDAASAVDVPGSSDRDDSRSGPLGISPPPGRGSSGQTVLRLVYFVEADREVDPLAVDAIERQALALQELWYEQFGGTFRLPAGGVDVVLADHPADWYDVTPNGDDERWYRLTNIREEVLRKLGIPDDDGSVRLITYPDARIDGRVGANRYEGAWMDGDDVSCIDDILATTPYTPDFPAGCLATVAHELGHVYGLGHQGPENDCMQFGFYQYVNGAGLCDFSPANRAVVTSDPRNRGWLDAAPGDRG